MSKHVAVLMGGWSAERDVSLDSGKACAAAYVGMRLPKSCSLGIYGNCWMPSNRTQM